MTCKYKVKIKDIQYNYKVQMTDIQSKYKFKVFCTGYDDSEIKDKIDAMYEAWPKASGEGETITLNDTANTTMSIDLKGNTSQDGTPTPDDPVAVSVVSGDNSIEVCGKNLFDGSKYNGVAQNTNGTYKTTKYYVDATETIFKGKPSTTYRITLFDANGDKPSASNPSRFSMSANGVWKNIATFSSNTFDTDANGEVKLKIGADSYAGVGITDRYIMITEATETPTFEDYEAYTGESYPISLGVENLFDKDNANYVNGWIDGTTMRLNTINGNRMFYIPCKPNTTYTISRSVITSSFRTTTYDSTPFPTVTSSNVNYTVPTVIQNNSGTTLTITTGANAKYLIVHYGKTEDINLNETLATIQVEYGSKQNSYTPYGTTPIELCKIGDYQDTIVKDNGKWYLNKQIGKVVLDGSESWTYSLQANVSRFDITMINAKKGSATSNPILSTHFKSEFALTNGNIFLSGSGNLISIMDNDFSNTNDFKNWLSSNNVTCYYGYTTPTYTEITDSTLISQLEALKEAQSYSGQTNISQTNDDKSFILTAKALKDLSSL